MVVTCPRLASFAGFIVLLTIVGCASAPQGAASAVDGTLQLVTRTAVNGGKIVAIRPIVVGPARDNQPSVNAVLSALQEQAVASPVALEELVINRTDNTVMSVVVETSNFAVGDRVTLVSGAEAAVIRRH